MSASHFGSGFWPDDYFGLYFQPEAGGVIIGTLSGSFAGAASFAGTLDQPATTLPVESGAHGRKRGRELQEFLDSLPIAARAPIAKPEPPVTPKPKPVRVVAKVKPAPAPAAQFDDEEDVLLLLLAA
jgi:hypothetical protein